MLHRIPSKYMCVGESSDESTIARFMKGSLWRLPHPGVIISVTGSATPDFARQLPPKIYGAFSRGLIGAARATRGWVMTGGTRTGVMECVGSIMASELAQRDIVLIGVSSCARCTATLQPLACSCVCAIAEA